MSFSRRSTAKVVLGGVLMVGVYLLGHSADRNLVSTRDAGATAKSAPPANPIHRQAFGAESQSSNRLQALDRRLAAEHVPPEIREQIAASIGEHQPAASGQPNESERLGQDLDDEETIRRLVAESPQEPVQNPSSFLKQYEISPQQWDAWYEQHLGRYSAGDQATRDRATVALLEMGTAMLVQFDFSRAEQAYRDVLEMSDDPRIQKNAGIGLQRALAGLRF